MSIFKVYRDLGGEPRLSELVITTTADTAQQAIQQAIALTCADDSVEQQKLHAEEIV